MRTKATTLALGILATCLLCAVTAQGRQRASGYCENGGVSLTVPGIGQISQPVMASYKSCTVTVYLSGSVVLASIYSDNAGTPKANPFTADATGAWFFYAENGRYDVRFSGGGIATPFTRGDYLLNDYSGTIACDASAQVVWVTAGAKIAACIAALPATGGTVDARGLEGPQTIAQNVFAGVTKPVRLLLGAASVASPYTITVGQVIAIGGTTIEGLGRDLTNLSYTAVAGTAITVTVLVGGDKQTTKLTGFSLYGPGKAVGAVTGIAVTSCIGFRLSELYLNGFSVDAVAVTGDVALGTNTNMGSADGVFVRDAGANGIRIEGNNSNVLYFVNLDIRGCSTGLYVKGGAGYPNANFFHGHLSGSTTNIKVEGQTNEFLIYIEDSALTTSNIIATGNFNRFRVLAYLDETKVTFTGTGNILYNRSNVTEVFGHNPTGLVGGGEKDNLVQETVASNPYPVIANLSKIIVQAANTQNWTGDFVNYRAAPLIEAGATGTLSSVTAFQVWAIANAGTITNFYGFRANATAGAGTFTNKWSFKGEAGAGIAEIADGIKTAGQFSSPAAEVRPIYSTPTFVETSAPNDQPVNGVVAQPYIGASNTQHWISPLGISAFKGRPVIAAGSSGSVWAMTSFFSYPDHGGGGTLSNLYGFRAYAPTGAGTISNKWSFKGEAGAGIAEIADGIKTANQIESTKATGTAPFVVASTTPVANLAATPTTYNAAGTQQTNTHVVWGTCTLGTSCAITLAGSAVFTNNTSYDCFPRDATTPANAVTVTRTSGSALAFTGTGVDVVNYFCSGN